MYYIVVVEDKKKLNMTKYEKIANVLKMEIMSGEYRDGLPSECRLAEIHKVAPLTARKALDELAKEGLIVRSPGRASRINEAMIAPVRICLGFEQDILNAISIRLKKKFPSIDFILENNAAERLSGKYDITFTPTSHLDSYSRHFSPLPAELVKELESSDTYRNNIFDLHKSNGLYYAMPILFSPPVIEFNLALLDRINLTLPETLDAKSLQKCRKALLALPEKPVLLDQHCFTEMLAFQFFYMNLPENWAVMKNADWFELCDKALTEYFALMKDDVGRFGEFAEGGTLMRITGRGLHDDPLDFPTAYTSFFGAADMPVHAFSVSLAIARDAVNKKSLTAICRAFLDADIQQLFKTSFQGIPARKATAYDAFCEGPARERIYMQEDQRCLFKRPEILRELIGTMWDEFPKYLNGQISAKDLREEINIFMRLNLKKQAISSRLMDKASQQKKLALSYLY